MTEATALFEPRGDAYVPAPATTGPWDARQMHGGAPASLLARTVEAVEPGADLAVVRLTLDFLSAVTIAPVVVSAEITKPGARFQIVEAILRSGDRVACRARAVRLRRDPSIGVPVTGPADPPLPSPEECELLTRLVEREGPLFNPDAVEIRIARGELGSGALAAWFRLHRDVVPGERPSPLSRVAAAADFSNGVSWVLPWEDYMFVNTELTIHLYREPAGEWIGLDARTAIGPEGAGLATGVLHDRTGPVGACAQALFVQPR